MAWRLRLAPEKTSIDFFRWQWATFGGSIALMVAAFAVWGVMGLNFGIDFKGGTTLRTESSTVIDTGLYRATLEGLDLGDVAVNEVFDPSFAADQHVASIRISGKDANVAITSEMMEAVKAALVAMDPNIGEISSETVGPKVSGELVTSSIIALASIVVPWRSAGISVVIENAISSGVRSFRLCALAEMKNRISRMSGEQSRGSPTRPWLQVSVSPDNN